MVSEMGLLPPGTGGLIVAGCGRPLMDDPHLILRSVGAACFALSVLETALYRIGPTRNGPSFGSPENRDSPLMNDPLNVALRRSRLFSPLLLPKTTPRRSNLKIPETDDPLPSAI